MSRGPCRRPLAALAALAGLVAVLAGSTPALASAPAIPHWRVESRAAPTNLPLNGGEGFIFAMAFNVGDAPAHGESEPITITDKLPEQLEITAVEAIDTATPGSSQVTHGLKCTAAPINPVQCTYEGPLNEFEDIELRIKVRSNYEAPAEPENEVTISGGGASKETLHRPLKVNGEGTEFGLEAWEMTPEGEDFEPERRPGSHPFQLTSVFQLNQTLQTYPVGSGFEIFPSAPALQQNIAFKLPPGLLGDTTAVPQCTGVQFNAQDAESVNSCPEETAIGIATVSFNDPILVGYQTWSVPVFNLTPAPGEPARFGFEIAHVPVVLDTSVRTGGDYGVTVTVNYASQAAQVLGATVSLWGAPADPRHDGARGWACLAHGGWVSGFNPRPTCESEPEPNRAFLTLPTQCNQPLGSTVQGTAWNGPELEAEGRVAKLEGEAANVTALTDCQELPFDPSIEVIPETHAASTPTALTVRVKLPQQTTHEADKLAEADIKETTLALPEGMTTSAGAVNGLETCNVEQAGFSGLDSDTGSVLEGEIAAQQFTPAPASCPEASKIGTVRIKTPVLAKELTGSVYLADQNTNPFGSPLALYLMAEEPDSKVLVKLVGEVVINQVNGQLVSHFRNTPQAPFETLELKLFKTERATQSTPAFCGPNPAKVEFVTWSGQTASAESNLEITSGPNDTPCPSGSLPFSPEFQAGSTNTQAGAFSPFSLTIRRPDGQQDLKSITMTLPPGAAAMLASVTPCPEPQAANDECGPESLIGHSTAVSGLGGAPVSISGEAFLTGPYKGAPFGILAVTNAEHVGPFNLGKIPVRSTINVDPNTAQATVTSDPLPQFVKGAPAQIKELNVTVDRAGFEFNPTNCTPMSVNGTLGGYEGASAGVSSRFQVAGCSSLPFTPKLTATVDAQGSKVNGIGFHVKVTSAGLGQAGIAKTFLTIPKILPSRLTTIQKACLEATFNANPASCPEGSVIASGTIHTPVFKNPLTGPAYLVSHGGAAFPDVEFVLQGEGITIVLDGKTDIKNGVTYSRFESTPDAPFTTFETDLPSGPHSALTANTEIVPDYNVCSQKITMPTEITGQNGAVIKQETNVEPVGCAAKPAVKPPLTRAQKLAKALKACKKLKKKSKRSACEKAARKRYGAKKVTKKPKKHSKKHR
ncbi:MAG TPA: hypothetical protein VMI13_05105 [Solirubrobacteraceae bacterium]|nr:hypothetical protein [Solirubrobacteraceae bacterium]